MAKMSASTSVTGSSGTNGTQSENDPLRVLHRVDEKVVIHETILQNLTDRQLEIRKKRLDILANLDSQKQKLAALMDQRKSLLKAKEKHEELKLELEKQLSTQNSSEEDDNALGPMTGGADESTNEDPIQSPMPLHKDNDTSGVCNGENNDEDMAWTGKLKPVYFLQTQTNKNTSFFPFVRSADLLKRILLVTRNHILELETKFPSKSPHQRRHALMLGSGIQVENDFQPNSRATMNISSRETTIEPAADKADHIDADNIICPYELAGECRDPYCSFQHLRPRPVESQILIKETLALPRLQLPKPPTSLQDLLLAQKQECIDVGKCEAPEEKRARVEGKLPPDHCDRDERNIDVAIAWSDDFVALPQVYNEEDESILLPWWMHDEERHRASKLSDGVVLSFSDILEVYYGANQSKTKESLRQEPIIPWIGRLLAEMGLCFIAGRLDRAHHVHGALLDICFRSEFPPTWKSAFDSIHDRFLGNAANKTGLAAIASLMMILIKMELLSELLRLCHELQIPLRWASWCLPHIVNGPWDESAPEVPTGVPHMVATAMSYFTKILKEFRSVGAHLEEDQASASEANRLRQSSGSDGFHLRVAFFAHRVIVTSSNPAAKSVSNLSRYEAAISLFLESLDGTLLVVPAQAFRVLLLCCCRRYDKAQSLLSNCLKSTLSSHHARYSSLLWSQLFQLRACLPSSDDFIDALVSYPSEQLGVWCNHLFSCGDDILLSTRDEKKNKLLKGTVLSLCQVPSESNMSPLEIDLDDSHLIPKAPVPVSFPLSLLVLGRSLSSLRLSGCNLGSMVPDSFGKHFPQLEQLYLCRNSLRSLPPTVGEMRRLKRLDASENEILEIPTSIGQCRLLEELYASRNDLSALPFTIVQCQKLLILDISSNRFAAEPNIAFKMGSLISFVFSGNPVTQTTAHT